MDIDGEPHSRIAGSLFACWLFLGQPTGRAVEASNILAISIGISPNELRCFSFF